jgi:transposase
MTCIDFPILLPGLKVTEVREQDNQINIYAVSERTQGICPECGKRSTRVHSYYGRSPADFPIAACRVRVYLRLKRFRCLTYDCSPATFVDEFPHEFEKHTRRTVRLYQAQKDIAFALDGEAGHPPQ